MEDERVIDAGDDHAIEIEGVFLEGVAGRRPLRLGPCERLSPREWGPAATRRPRPAGPGPPNAPPGRRLCHPPTPPRGPRRVSTGWGGKAILGSMVGQCAPPRSPPPPRLREAGTARRFP